MAASPSGRRCWAAPSRRCPRRALWPAWSWWYPRRRCRRRCPRRRRGRRRRHDSVNLAFPRASRATTVTEKTWPTRRSTATRSPQFSPKKIGGRRTDVGTFAKLLHQSFREFFKIGIGGKSTLKSTTTTVVVHGSGGGKLWRSRFHSVVTRIIRIVSRNHIFTSPPSPLHTPSTSIL